VQHGARLDDNAPAPWLHGAHSNSGLSVGRTTCQRSVLGEQDVLAALSWLAKMHAAFWQEPEPSSVEASGFATPLDLLWPNGMTPLTINSIFLGLALSGVCV
jgi:hypothetical protein